MFLQLFHNEGRYIMQRTSLKAFMLCSLLVPSATFCFGESITDFLKKIPNAFNALEVVSYVTTKSEEGAKEARSIKVNPGSAAIVTGGILVTYFGCKEAAGLAYRQYVKRFGTDDQKQGLKDADKLARLKTQNEIAELEAKVAKNQAAASAAA